MTVDILKVPRPIRGKMISLLVLTALLAGRAMTLPFISRAGGSAVGDPPAAWLMPLVGDAAIGLGALVILGLLLTKRSLGVWTCAVAWNAVAIWDAGAAFLIHHTNPWPSFFMVEIFGDTMFVAAIAMHAGCIWILTHDDVRRMFVPDVAPEGARSVRAS